jgi:hypothetical protein
MHEIRVSLPSAFVPEVVRLANSAGIKKVTVSEVFVFGAEENQRVITVESSTPRASRFVESLLDSTALSNSGCTFTSREVRAIVDASPVEELTYPMSEPFPDICQDLWQLSHLTPSYLGRCAAGAILLATGLLHNDPIAIVVAALFFPFLSQVLSFSFGVWYREWRLAVQGMAAIATSIVVALAAGATVATVEGGIIGFSSFKTPLASFAISAVIGIAAGPSSADDAGRRYLISVAAAVQFAVFPVWFGEAIVLGLPLRAVWGERLVCFLINLVTIAAAAPLSYAILHLKHGRVEHYGAPN